MKKVMPENYTEVKILFLADTHLGFDYPIKPKIERRRRGDDFFKNYNIILEEVFDKKVDFVLHGGDMFFRAKVHPSIVLKSFEPLLKIAEMGIPVLIVPGNHERSFLPVTLLETHPNIFAFDKSCCFNFNIHKISVCFAGFPCIRKNIRNKFTEAVEDTGFKKNNADFKFLCLHQTVEGATVGVQNFTFRYGEDIIRCADIPQGLDAVLSGHIHRAQVLNKDLSGKQLNCPVIYPGAIERTSFAERNETKGYYILKLSKDIETGAAAFESEFKPLYARPMIDISINLNRFNSDSLQSYIKESIAKCNKDAVVRIRVSGNIASDKMSLLTAKYLRETAPTTMNVELAIPFKDRSE